jgi:trans-aconitate methyltransferase
MQINLHFSLVPTPLCEIMERCGSDKGGKSQWHNYTCLYYPLFKDMRNHPLKVFELGIGTNNPNLKSNMGFHGVPGASLRAWKEFFPHSKVYGADIDKNILFSDERIETFYCDQCDPASIRSMWEQINAPMDIIIEDGLHEFEANVCFFENSWMHLVPGGLYIIEDITKECVHKMADQARKWKETLPFEFYLIELPHHNTWDNCLLVCKRY